jgi:uncharacterized protein
MPKYTFDLALLIEICKNYDVTRIDIFGSMAREDFSAESDIDLLLEFAHPIDLFQMVHLRNQLIIALGRQVDITTRNGLSPYIKEDVLRKAILLYEKK